MTARQQALVTINTNPQSASPLAGGGNFPTARTGTPWSGALWGVGGAGGYGYTVISKPAWVTASTVDIFLLLSGTPGASGAVVVDITDSAATVQRVSFYITVTSAITGVGAIVSAQPAYTGQPYSLDLTTFLTGATVPLTSSVVSTGTLPTGMTIHSTTGIIDATNVTGTTQDVVVTITDGASKVAVIPLHLAVKPGLSASTNAPNGVLGVPYQGQVTVSGGSGKYSIVTVSTNPLSAGLVVAPTTGKITGVPTALTPTTGAPTTHFQITDLVTGQQIITTLIGGGSKFIAIASVAAPAPRGRFSTYDAAGALTSLDVFAGYFGDGADGDIVLDGTNTYATLYSKVGSVYTQLRPIYANTITFGSNITLNTSGLPTFVKTNTIGTGATNVQINANRNGAASAFFGITGTGGAGGIGATGVGGAGQAATPSGTQATLIGVAGNGANGGGGTNAGGGQGAAQVSAATIGRTSFPFRMPFMPFTWGFGCIAGGLAGGGGGGGGGSGSLAGANGGAGGDAAGVLYWFSYAITTDATTAWTWNANGSSGGAGANSPGVGRGASAGGGGSTGGVVWIVCVFRDGPLVVNAAKVNGGDGGAAGTGGTTAPGTAQGASSGFAFFFALASNASLSVGIVPASGITGGVGQLTW
jgi:hypothetical protein